ncbi:MAG TPA: FHA domain-containing protein, partial [Polyangiaceae bacterium]
MDLSKGLRERHENDDATSKPAGGPAVTGDFHRLVHVFWEGGHRQQRLPESGEVILGRGESSCLRLDLASISRRHARLVLGAEVFVEDLGSRNGTRIGGKVLRPGAPRRLEAGDIVEIGDAMLVVQAAAQAVPRTTLPPERDVVGAEAAASLPFRRLLERVAKGK